MSKAKIVISRKLPQAALAHARELFDVAEGPADRDMTWEETLAALEREQPAGLVFANNIVLDGAAVASLPACLAVAATVSVGFDHVDVAAAKARNLMVTNTPGVLTDCTADFAMLLMLGAARRAKEYLAIAGEGWPRVLGANEMLGIRLSGKTLGILGMGRIGQAVARRAHGFGMFVLYSDVKRLDPATEAGCRYFPDPEAMLPECHFLSLHAPAMDETHRWLNAKRLSLLPRGAVVMNSARGVLVDEDALLEALKSGHIAAAGLDVFAHEPGGNRELISTPQVFATPHMASATLETRTDMGLRALDNVAAYLGRGQALDPLWRLQ
ncbi:hypothetical protein X743_30145 [Mesorhizobium sp. LNHC252B00]|uniref:2-hydroxyacid dehydrogenase n=1 Tax=Mesorhizobium sp. LNHC252B00 TaxID=1287252 RepID=UPI0003CEE445|nr:D-glycerate dehydrogenase [Mesorhizobium sp. LNHC252B00]ESY64922.1 hypothetical protein X743_30145 [Mesorhizobium sp. LNHC252B00]